MRVNSRTVSLFLSVVSIVSPFSCVCLFATASDSNAPIQSFFGL
jgi:hypothetical protein